MSDMSSLSDTAASTSAKASSIVSTTAASTSGAGEEKDQVDQAFVRPTGTASNLANTADDTATEAPSSTPESTILQIIKTQNPHSPSVAMLGASPLAAAVEIAPSNTNMFAPVTPSASASSGAKPVYDYPSAERGNLAMASGFNQVYKTLSETSKCDASNVDQAFACISGELAQCQADGTYVLKSCDIGQSCYALPKTSGQTGVSVECAVPSDAAARMAGQEPSRAATSITTPVATIAQASAPAPETVSAAVSTPQNAPANTAGNGEDASNSNQSAQANVVKVSQAESTAQPQSTNNPQNIEQGILTKLPETESVQIPVETSISPQLTAVVPTQTEQPATLSAIVAASSAQVDNGGSQNEQHPPKTSAEAKPSTIAESGPLFSVVDVSPSSALADKGQQATTTENSTPPATTSSLSSKPSLLAEQKPAPFSEPPAVPAPAPHFIQTIEKPQQTQDVQKPTPVSSADAAGITFEPLGGNMGVNNNNNNKNQGGNGGVEQKMAIGNANVNADGPIYITVTTTVTTTAYTRGP